MIVAYKTKDANLFNPAQILIVFSHWVRHSGLDRECTVVGHRI
jgi:hypothetical protein